MTKRVLISPSRVSISKPGYDVESPPAITSDYLSMDSSFEIYKPVQVGLVIGGLIYPGFTVTYAATHPTPPCVEMYMWNAANRLSRHTILHTNSGGTKYWSLMWRITQSVGSFNVSAPGIITSVHTTPYNFLWIAWPTS